MKKRRLVIMLSVVLLTCIQGLMAQSKEEQKELIANKVKNMVESKKFMVSVDRVVPMNGRTVNLTSQHSLEIKNDSVLSYLPYFGQAYSLPYGGGASMNFESLIKEYKQKYNKKGTAQITFRTRSADDTYTFRMQIYPNASVVVNVNSINRQTITYYGTLLYK